MDSSAGSWVVEEPAAAFYAKPTSPRSHYTRATGCCPTGTTPARVELLKTPYCTEAEVAEAVFAAATEQGSKIRYPAGADTKLVADLRWTTSEDHYLEKMRDMFSPLQARRRRG